jgi:hypothetical membrane protein
MNIYQIFAIFGMISPIIYTAMWIIGGRIQSDYSHIRDDISSLYAIGAPNKKLMQSFIIISSILLLVFFIGLNDGITDGGGSIVGPNLLLLSSIFGVLVAIFFPLDSNGQIVTWKGKMHLTLVVGMGLLTIAGMVALWLRLQSNMRWSIFAHYSLTSALFAFILVIISLIFIKSKYRGLLERLMVTPYQVYYFILSMMIFLNN